MKISVITVCFNSAATLEQTILSVINQTHSDTEYIVIDGGSTDGTREIIKKYKSQISEFVSEKDQGIYDAMNKGLALATGDIIGILNSDDLYKNNQVLEIVNTEFNAEIDCLSTDVEIFKGTPENIVRYYSATRWKPWMFRIGHQPPHPGFFVRRKCYEIVGNFNTAFKLGADFDMLYRLICKHGFKTAYRPWVSVSMRGGGASQKNLANINKANKEVNQSLNQNGAFSIIPLIWLKYPLKIFQFIFR